MKLKKLSIQYSPTGLLLLFFVSFFSLNAQDYSETKSQDPIDIFILGWSDVRKAEKLDIQGKYVEAFEKYKEAENYYLILDKTYHDWKTRLVQSRLGEIRKSISDIKPKVIEELSRGIEQKSTGQAPDAYTTQPALPKKTEAPSLFPERNPEQKDTTQESVFKKIQDENIKLKKQMEALQQSAKSQNDASKNKEIQKLLDQKEKEIGRLRSLMSNAPMQQEISKINQEKAAREAELTITARALKEAQNQLKKARELALQEKQKLENAEQKTEEILKQMQEQKQMDNKVVNSLREDLKKNVSIIEETRLELNRANQRSVELQRRFKETTQTINALKKSNEALLKEKEANNLLAKKEGSSAMKQIMAENVQLAKTLKETQGRLKHLEKNKNSTKDQLLETKNNLDLAKHTIIRQQEEQTTFQEKIKSLQNQLADAQKEINKNPKSMSPNQKLLEQEILVLKQTVKRLTSAEKERQKEEKKLWNLYKKSKIRIPEMDEAFTQILKDNSELSAKEKKLLTTRKPDIKLTNTAKVSPEKAKQKKEALKEEIKAYEPRLKRALSNKNYKQARALLTEMDSRFPGHFPTLCHLGILELKTNKPENAVNIFSEAVTIHDSSSYAHFMLGLSCFRNAELERAEKSFKRSLEIKPNNADAWIYLGAIQEKKENYTNAENCFIKALKIEPSNIKAHYNLSLIYQMQDRKEEAMNSYKEALANGMKPNPQYEKKISQSTKEIKAQNPSEIQTIPKEDLSP